MLLVARYLESLLESLDGSTQDSMNVQQERIFWPTSPSQQGEPTD